MAVTTTKTIRMTTELTRYNGYRYVMRKGQRFGFSDDADKIKAGRAMLIDADMPLWESNAALVARVESFLRSGFSWYSQSDKSARDTLKTLLSYVRDGAVDIVQENGATTNAFENGGFTLDPPARRDRPDTPPFDYDALLDADRESLRKYNAAIDARIEQEARLSPSPFETVQESDMPYLLSVVSMVARSANFGRQATQQAESGFNEIADEVSTPLGDAVPFEYVKSTTGDNVLSIAARGVSQRIEEKCFSEYERALDLCRLIAPGMGGLRGMTLCKQNAFDNFQQCRGY